jgi:signal transduction histidine kinase
VSIYDTDSKLIEVNDAFARFYKFRNKEECFRTLDEYPNLFETRFPDGTIAPIGMWAGPRARRGEKASNAEYIIIRKDTGEKWIANYSFGPIIDSDQNINGSVVVGRDVTEQKRMEESLRRNSLELSELNAMKDKLLNIISHDLKNPFTVLLGYIDMMLNNLDSYGKDKIRDILVQLENSAKGAFAILENLSEWSRLQSGTMLFNPVQIELGKIIDENISIFSTYAHRAKR